MTEMSVIIADKTIILDGVPLKFEFEFYPSKLRAIQWNGVNGTMEFKTGPAVWFDNPAQVQDYIDQYNAEAARIAAEAAEAAKVAADAAAQVAATATGAQ